MPSHTVINRRNLDSTLVRKTVMVSDDAVKAASATAKRLSVSQGSVIDTALRLFAGLDDATVIEALRTAGHLTDQEHAAVLKRLNHKEAPS